MVWEVEAVFPREAGLEVGWRNEMEEMEGLKEVKEAPVKPALSQHRAIEPALSQLKKS
jgi:hypothetical protein